jgi:dolichyl-phosphate-mannose--protein O-mannosyl transferase
LEGQVKRLYLVLAVLGFTAPYYFLVSFLRANGFDLRLMVDMLFGNPISTFFAVDLVISAVVFLVWSFSEVRRLQLPSWWIYLILTFLVGPSFSIPLFLFAREGRSVPAAG